MQYREAGKTGKRLSLLGYGCMRFTHKGARIDQEKTERELALALEKGVNYFDTAYTYPGCEEALGRFIAKNDRDRMFIATKLPHFSCTSAADFDRIFNEQLARLQTDHIDFYLMHMLTSMGSWERIVALGVEDWIAAKMASGAIRHIGFSYHGGREDFKRLCDVYPWEFAQIQCNYLDAHAQAGLEGLHYAAEKGLAVIVMEPLRGGRLATKLPRTAARAFECVDASLSPADWAMQWLYDDPAVTCVLSGMNATEQIEENCALASRVEPHSLTMASRQAYRQAIAEIRKVEKVACTGCGYCLPCPHGVDIPTCFRCFNTTASEGWFAGFKEYIMTTTLRCDPTNAGRCVGCGLCVSKCSQSISIPETMEQVKQSMEGIPYKLVDRFKGVRFKV